MIGLEPHIVVGGGGSNRDGTVRAMTDIKADELPIQGNIILDKFFGAKIYTPTQCETRTEVANRLALESGLNFYRFCLYVIDYPVFPKVVYFLSTFRALLLETSIPHYKCTV